MDSYEHCKNCGTKLKEVKLVRVRPTKCNECRHHSRNYEFKKLMEECAKNSIPEEGFFEDIKFDPDESIMHRSKPSSEIGVKSSLGTL